MAAGGEFVEGWLLAQVLGEGAYGEVRLLVNARTGAAVALKAVRGEEGGETAREAALHRALRHPNVLRCLGERAHQGLHYMFLEYAQGGELFDRIEPDVGMSERSARRYWRQLAAGLRYVHARGVAHRDIKPENLLLDAQDNIKIADFGMATLFRHGNRERLMSRVCGTIPYAAPEVLMAATRPYRAPPADSWGAALVLLAMLRGELPWERASPDEARFAAWNHWLQGSAACSPPQPFDKLSLGALRFLRSALHPSPGDRATLEQLQAVETNWPHTTEYMEDDIEEGPDCGRTWRSQPSIGGWGAVTPTTDAPDGARAAPDELSAADMGALLTHSQPAHNDDLLLASQHKSLSQQLVRRMTRLWVCVPPAEALRALRDAAASLGYSCHAMPTHTMLIECDSSVRIRALATASDGPQPHTLLELRRSRGCGLEFKRRFLRLRPLLKHLELSADY